MNTTYTTEKNGSIELISIVGIDLFITYESF
jgi:hypothetical protein